MRGALKFIFGFLFCFAFRLMPRPPNIEPITAATMPFSKRYGKIAGFSFGFLSIFFLDLLTGKFGVWTIVTATMFGLIGLSSAVFFKGRKAVSKNFVLFSIMATLVYDFITGPIMSSIIFKISFTQALIGQIPFTLWHLSGNIVFAAIISPLLYRWVINNRAFETDELMKRFSHWL